MPTPTQNPTRAPEGNREHRDGAVVALSGGVRSLALFLLLAGCGGSGSPANGSCQDWGSTLCARACECGTQGQCMYGNASGTFTVHFNSRSDCDLLWMASCAQPNANSSSNMAYFAACADALHSATCNTSGHYLIFPDVCSKVDAGVP